MTEEWRWIKGYEGLYEVSNLGNIRSWIKAGRGGTSMRRSPRIRKHLIHKDGYHYIGLGDKNYQVHRLVAEAFIPNLENKPQVDHIDTDPSNNRADNLRWATQSENNLNPITRKRRSEVLRGNKKLIESGNRIRELRGKKVICEDTGEIYPSICIAQSIVGMGSRKSLQRKSNSYKGRKYRVLEEV